MAALGAHSRIGGRPLKAGIASAVVLAAIGLDTKIVRIGSPESTQAGAFAPSEFGTAEFPKVQAAVEKHAVEAATLAASLAKDQDGAVKRYGLTTDTGSEMTVKFTGVAGKQDLGVYDVTVPGVSGVHIAVQTGPAIDGTSLRDGSGLYTFGQFRNQIDYQNAGAALNAAMKRNVLAKLDTKTLSGKTILVFGVFDLSDPSDWLVTPVRLEIK